MFRGIKLVKQTCKYSKYCGGCKELEKDYSLVLKEKSEYLKTLFKDFKDVVHDCVGNYYPFKQRNKIHLAFSENKGKTLIGFFEEGSTRVVDIDSCLMHDKWATLLIAILREYVSRFKIRPFKDGVGILRYAHARCVENKLQLTLVAVTDNFSGREWLYKKLCENFSQVSFYININNRTDRAIFGDRFKHINGEKYLQFNMCGVKVVVSPSSFLQVNLGVAEKMYKKALELMDINKDTTVIDLYSGIGITSVMFSKNCKNVFAIEEVESATKNAKIISQINECKNIHVFTGKCEDKLHSMQIEGNDDVRVFVDPARLGLDKKVIDEIIRVKPEKIVYMSCNPETCLHDIKYLLNSNNYTVSDIFLYDMFSYTKHTEVLVCLQRRDT